ncbi:hypothetical protein TRFO_41883 [Tritrichomonas foetus]|uniref:Uncharacterized protein n=1 Tax=Tritrichomonas foetus TaxID=1144522 RepID=A0A1J4KYI8_9EUKA|nr:hypothetical protein TRFO_41883 [Tritrichomonas foetus]|eukprot:OHT16329.1 hypothetical protein TRFO_41883 [Tritrichomonas foetus]
MKYSKEHSMIYDKKEENNHQGNFSDYEEIFNREKRIYDKEISKDIKEEKSFESLLNSCICVQIPQDEEKFMITFNKVMSDSKYQDIERAENVKNNKPVSLIYRNRLTTFDDIINLLKSIYNSERKPFKLDFAFSGI